MADVTIDTNVLVHTGNKSTHFYSSAIKTLEIVKTRDLSICVDDVFSLDGAKNTSVIGHEYIQHVRQGTFAYMFLLDRLTKNKVVQITKKNYKNVKQAFNKKIMTGEMNKPHDIAYVITAYGSDNKLLISNDHDDFNDAIREYVLNKFSVTILDSDEYVGGLVTSIAEIANSKS